MFRWTSEGPGQLRWWIIQGCILLINPSLTNEKSLLFAREHNQMFSSSQSHHSSHLSHSLLFFVLWKKRLIALFLLPLGKLVDIQYTTGMFFLSSQHSTRIFYSLPLWLSLCLLYFTSPAGPRFTCHTSKRLRSCEDCDWIEKAIPLEITVN